MALLEPLCAFKLVEGLKNSLCTYSVCAVWVSKVACKIDLVRLDLLEKCCNDVNVGLSALALLDASCLIERKVEEVAVGCIVESE